jgi:hypothetical protein
MPNAFVTELLADRAMLMTAATCAAVWPAVTGTDKVATVASLDLTVSVNVPRAAAPELTVNVYTLGIALVASVPPPKVAVPTVKLVESFELREAVFDPVESVSVTVAPLDEAEIFDAALLALMALTSVASELDSFPLGLAL